MNITNVSGWIGLQIDTSLLIPWDSFSTASNKTVYIWDNFRICNAKQNESVKAWKSISTQQSIENTQQEGKHFQKIYNQIYSLEMLDKETI